MCPMTCEGYYAARMNGADNSQNFMMLLRHLFSTRCAANALLMLLVPTTIPLVHQTNYVKPRWVKTA
jgi:hypothetical protein